MSFGGFFIIKISKNEKKDVFEEETTEVCFINETFTCILEYSTYIH